MFGRSEVTPSLCRAVDSNGQVVLNADYRSEEYRVLCRNGSVSKHSGLLVDSDCTLASGIVGEVT